MFKQQALGQRDPAPADPSWSDEAPILDWIDAWQPVRDDVLELLNAYARSDKGHDISSFMPLIEQLDSTMRLLRYRVGWLHEYLQRDTEPPQGNSR